MPADAVIIWNVTLMAVVGVKNVVSAGAMIVREVGSERAVAVCEA